MSTTMNNKTTVSTMPQLTSENNISNKKTKIYVQHDYSDHSDDPMYDETSCPSIISQNSIKCGSEEKTVLTMRRGPRGGVIEPFPTKLHQMLSKADEEGFTDVVSWQPHGRCFVIHNPKKFVSEVMPKFFKQSKFTSFQRQVNLYGFRRLTKGVDRGGYYHELFLRGRFDLCKRIIRTRIKGTGAKPAYSPETEPNFYSMKPCSEKSHLTNNHTSERSQKIKPSIPPMQPQQTAPISTPIYTSTTYPVNPPKLLPKWGESAVVQQPTLANMAESIFAPSVVASSVNPLQCPTPLQHPPSFPSNSAVYTDQSDDFVRNQAPIRPAVPSKTVLSTEDLMMNNLEALAEIDPSIWDDSFVDSSTSSSVPVVSNVDDEEFFDKLTFHYLDTLGSALGTHFNEF